MAGSVLVRFKHPTKDLSFLSSLLSMECTVIWKAGSPKRPPLKGTYPISYWVSRLEFSGEEGFEENLFFAIDRLKKVRETVLDLKSSGGIIEIYLQLPGAINNGGTIETEVLKDMCDLNIDLLVEVFPNIPVS